MLRKLIADRAKRLKSFGRRMTVTAVDLIAAQATFFGALHVCNGLHF